MHLGELQLEGDIFGIQLPHLLGGITDISATATTDPGETFATGECLVALGRCSGAAGMIPESAYITLESLIVSANQDLTGPTRRVIRDGRHHSGINGAYVWIVISALQLHVSLFLWAN